MFSVIYKPSNIQQQTYTNMMNDFITKWLLVPGALNYSFERLIQEQRFAPEIEEKDAIALALCGAANDDLAIDFMNGTNHIEAFIKNVSYNGPDSAPLVMRALQLRLMAIEVLNAEYALKTAAVEEDNDMDDDYPDEKGDCECCGSQLGTFEHGPICGYCKTHEDF